MSGNKHTPGPWTVEVSHGGMGTHWLIGAPEPYDFVGHFYDEDGQCENGEANATLMAAAPDLLEAFERAYDTMKDLPDFFEEGSHEHKALTAEAEAIRLAIVKAKVAA